MAKYEKRLKALDLRKQGYSIKSIAKQLGVSKSAVSLWCRGIILTNEQKQSLHEYMVKASEIGRILGKTLNRTKKLERLDFWENEGLKEFSNLSYKDLSLIGPALYWAEGSKTKSQFIFTNSDPIMIKLVQVWLEKCLGVSKEDLKPRVQINYIHEERIEKVLNFWANLLELPVTQFSKPYYVKTKHSKVYENHDNYFGILSLSVRKSSEVLYRVLGQISALKQLSM